MAAWQLLLPIRGPGCSGFYMRVFRYSIRFSSVFLFLAICGLSGMALGQSADRLILATTTSTDNTGLLDALAPGFEKATGIRLLWTAVGTGKALALGKNCDVDALFVHAPEAEAAFVAAGYGIQHRRIMMNDFVIIGPLTDPAGVSGLDAPAALRKIKASGQAFVSRGDNSGTHMKERQLWNLAETEPPRRPPAYVETGQGMLTTIRIARERGAYTLTDRGTYIKYESDCGGSPPLVIWVQGGPELENPYSAMAVNPEKCPSVRHRQAMAFLDWLSGPFGRKIIQNFRLEDKPLFYPVQPDPSP